jgi:hypothetical protein
MKGYMYRIWEGPRECGCMRMHVRAWGVLSPVGTCASDSDEMGKSEYASWPADVQAKGVMCCKSETFSDHAKD